MSPWDDRVRAAVKSGRQMTGLWPTWDDAMRDAWSLSQYYRVRVRVGKLTFPWDTRWYVLELP